MSVEVVHAVIAFTYLSVWMLIGQTSKKRSPQAAGSIK